MTDNEIIKALEWYVSKFKNTGYVYLDVDGTKFVSTQEVLDLITRQQAKIESLKVENQSLRTAGNSLKMHYEEAQVEIERLGKIEIEIDDFCRRLCRMRMLNGSAIASYEDLQNYIQEEKSEAVKNFAERLKEKANKMELVCSGALVRRDYTIDEEILDNLVKEIIGE